MTGTIDASRIVAVKAERLENNWYRYTAIDENGNQQVIRQRATLLYEKAYQYAEQVNSGNKTGLARYFSFGKHPKTYYTPIKEFGVKIDAKAGLARPVEQEALRMFDDLRGSDMGELERLQHRVTHLEGGLANLFQFLADKLGLAPDEIDNLGGILDF